MVRSAFLETNLMFLAALSSLAFGLGSKASAMDLKEAEAMYKARNYQKVIELLSPGVEKLDRAGLMLLGNAYCGTKNHTSATKTFTAIFSKKPNDHEAKTLIAREHIHMGKDKEALAFLKEALETDPKFEPAYRLVSSIYEKKNDKYELRILYQDMIEKLGERPEFVTRLCEITTSDGLYESATNYCQKGAKLSPQEAKNHVHLGLIYKETGKTKKAQETLKKAADTFQRSDFAQITYAKFLEDQKNYVDAYVFYKRAAAANAMSYVAHIGVGQSALEIQKFEESLDAFKKACGINRSAALFSLRKAASVLRTMGNTPWLKKFETVIDTCNS